MRARKRREVVDAGDRPVLTEHHAEHRRRLQPGEPHEIDGALGMAHLRQDAAALDLHRKHVAGHREVARTSAVGDGDGDGAGAISGGDPGRHAVARLDRGTERRLTRRRRRGEKRNPEVPHAALGQRDADEAARVGG